MNFVLKIMLKAIDDYWSYLFLVVYKFSSNQNFHLERFCWNIFGKLVYYLMIVVTLNIFLSWWVFLIQSLLCFLLDDGFVRHNFFQHLFRCHLFFVSKLVELRQSIASIENIICYLNDIRFLKFPRLKVTIFIY